MRKKIIKFGEDVEGFYIAVLNKREIRSAAGILFLLMFISVFTVLFKSNFILLKFAITIILSDLLILAFINPKFFPSLILQRLFVNRQMPEYVGAVQKIFAWMIGVVIATTMFILQIVVISYSPITGIMCFVCLIYLFSESAFGICLGCKFYSLFYKEKAQYCPSEVCGASNRTDIQKTSITQVFIVIGFFVFVSLAVLLLKDEFSKNPFALFEFLSSSKSK